MGSLGCRYGSKVRKKYYEIIKKKNTLYKCPSCGLEKIKRISTGVWKCKHCNLKLAGGAYSLTAGD